MIRFCAERFATFSRQVFLEGETPLLLPYICSHFLNYSCMQLSIPYRSASTTSACVFTDADADQERGSCIFEKCMVRNSRSALPMRGSSSDLPLAFAHSGDPSPPSP